MSSPASRISLPGSGMDVIVRVLLVPARYVRDRDVAERQKAFDWRGPLAYENEGEGPYFKLGVYWSPAGLKPIVVYHDNYSRGHSYAEVDPAVQHGCEAPPGWIGERVTTPIPSPTRGRGAAR